MVGRSYPTKTLSLPLHWYPQKQPSLTNRARKTVGPMAVQFANNAVHTLWFLAPSKGWKNNWYNPLPAQHDAVPHHLHYINYKEHHSCSQFQGNRRTRITYFLLFWSEMSALHLVDYCINDISLIFSVYSEICMLSQCIPFSKIISSGAILFYIITSKCM